MNGGTIQSSLTWSPHTNGTYVVEVARYFRDPLLSDGNLLYSQPSACDDTETTTAGATVTAQSQAPSINADTTHSITAPTQHRHSPVTAPTADPNVLPSINAECSGQTVEYGSGAIRQWSQDLLASQTYTWSTIGQTSEVGARGAVVLLAASPRFEPRPLP